MAQKTDLNVAPYYDDFDSTDNFHKILFRPGFAVQARELTQLQSILQNQIERHGNNIFKDGTVKQKWLDIKMELLPHNQLYM
jgi:hypothetical protein